MKSIVGPFALLVVAACCSCASSSDSSDASGGTDAASSDAGQAGHADDAGDAAAPTPGGLSPTAKRVLNAYGGEATWKNATTIKMTATVGGALFQSKGRGVPPHAMFTVDVQRPHTVITPIDAEGNTGVLDGFSVTIQSPTGAVIDHRDDARQSLQNASVSTQWDELNLLYFVGYAFWTYNVLPAQLSRSDIQWTEVEDGVLSADFGTNLPVHSRIQRFWFDPQTNLLTRNDYSPIAAAMGVDVAHLVLAHGTAGSVPYPMTRRVRLTPQKYGPPEASPDYITIDVDAWQLQ